MTSKTFADDAIVLKRRSLAEADRLLTVYTKNHGKQLAVAKGVRKLSSRKKGSLEPGMLSRCFFVNTKGFTLLTQAQLIKNFTRAREHLTGITQTLQLLEIIDSLTAENEPNEDVFQLLLEALELLEENGTKKDKLLAHIEAIVKVLGFGPPPHLSENELRLYIEDLANRRLKAKEFLSPATK